MAGQARGAIRVVFEFFVQAKKKKNQNGD